MTRQLAPADAATVERARRLAHANHPDRIRMWFAKGGDELSARRAGTDAYVAGFGAAQSLLAELARLAEQPDRPGIYDYTAATVEHAREALADVRAALADDVSPGPALDRLAADLDRLAAYLPAPIRAPAADLDGPAT